MSAAERAERIALAVAAGTVSAADAREDLHLATAEREAEQAAAALRAYRAGRPVWSWPARAPWMGF